MKFISWHIADLKLNNPWRRMVDENHISKIRIFGDDDQLPLAGIIPQMPIRHTPPNLCGVNHGKSGNKSDETRKIFIKQKTCHAT